MSFVLRLIASLRQYKITFFRSAASVDCKFRFCLRRDKVYGEAFDTISGRKNGTALGNLGSASVSVTGTDRFDHALDTFEYLEIAYMTSE